MKYSACHSLFIAVFLLAGILPCAAHENTAAEERSPLPVLTIQGRDHGIVPDTDEDMGPPLRRLLSTPEYQEVPVTIVLEKGLYCLHGAVKDFAAVRLENLKHITLAGAGKETFFVVRNPSIGAFALINCEKVSFQNFSIDYNPVPYAVGTVLLVEHQSGFLDVALSPQFPQLSEPWFGTTRKATDQWGMIFDAQKDSLMEGVSDRIHVQYVKQLSHSAWRIQLSDKSDLQGIRPGSRYLHLAPYVQGGALFYGSCSDCSAQDLTIYASPGIGIGSFNSSGLSLSKIHVERKVTSARPLSTNAEAVHSQDDRDGPLVENCRLMHMAGDGIVIYGMPHTITSLLSPTELRVLRNSALRQGDSVQLFDAQRGEHFVETQILELQPAPCDEDRITLSHELKGIRPGPITLDLYNQSRNGSGFVLRNNHIENHRRHGMIIRASQGIIENNELRDFGGLGILIGNSTSGPGAGLPCCLSVRNNLLVNGGRSRWYAVSRNSASIQIGCFTAGGKTAPTRAIHDVVLENNDIINPPGAALYLGAVRNVLVQGLQVDYTQTEGSRNSSAIMVENGDNVKMSHIRVNSASRQLEAAVSIGEDCAQGDAGVLIEEIQLSGAVDTQLVVDKRLP